MTHRTFLPVLLGLAACHPVAAAPPVLTHLVPAGAARGTTVEVTAGGTFERWPVGTWISGKGVEVRPGKQKGKLTLTVAPDATPGPRWIRVHDEEGASTLRPFLVGMLPEAAEQEPNDDYRKAQRVPGTGIVVNGRLDRAGDVDCYVVELRKGQTLVASVDAHSALASPMDAVVQVVSASGFVLAQNNDHRGLDPQVAHRAVEDGAHVVRLFAFPSVPDSSIRFSGGERFVYRLTMTTGPFVEHAFPLAVERGKPAAVELIGWNLPPGSSRVDIASGDDEEVLVQAREGAGVAWVRREEHACVTHARPGEGTPQTVPIPVTVSGRFDRDGELHAYRFQGRKGQRVSFQVESASLGFQVDGVVRVRDGKGDTLSQTRSTALGRDSVLEVTLPRDETYLVQVSDLNGRSGPEHFYRLRALLPTSERAPTVASEQFLVPPGKSLDVPVKLERAGDNLTFEVEGLPAGVRVETLPIGKGARTATLRFAADESAGGKGGAIRILARSKDAGTRPQAAQTPLAEYNTTTTHLWLSVTTAKIVPVKKKRRQTQ